MNKAAFRSLYEQKGVGPMIKGHIAALQRDHAWDGFSQAERKAGQSEGIYDPFRSPEQNKPTESFESRQEREDIEYSRLDGADAGERGRQARGAGAARMAADIAQDKEKRDKQKRDTMELLSAVERLNNFEDGIAATHGENFADNLFADLHADDLISDEDYKDVMAIDDLEERRRAIAKKIQEGLDNGTITPEDLKDHPWAEEWLDKYQDVVAERNRQAEAALENGQNFDEIDVDARDMAGANVSDDVADKLDAAALNGESKVAVDVNSENRLDGLGPKISIG